MSCNHPVMNFSKYKYPERPEMSGITVPCRPSKHNLRQPTVEFEKQAEKIKKTGGYHEI